MDKESKVARLDAYSVISETLWEKIPILDDGTGPSEPYAIAHVVVAEGRARARWMAWQSDKNTWTSDPRDMPKFSVRLLRKGVKGPPRLATDEPEYRELWAASMADDPECLRAEIDARKRDRDDLIGAFLRTSVGGYIVAVPDELAGREFSTREEAISAIGLAVGLIDLIFPEPAKEPAR